jgi:hypothetical protein
MRYLVILLIIVLTSCESHRQNQVESSQVFVIDSLINKEINHLAQVNAQLKKKVTYKEQEEVVKLNSGEVNWSNELAVFRSMDISKPSLFDAYRKSDEIRDSVSNLTIMSFQLNEGEISPVKMLNVYYLNDITSLKKITAIVSSGTMLNDSKRELELIFDQKQGQTILTGYSILTHDKQLFKEIVEVIIEGEVLY